jgi:hypothetical protein
MLKVAAQRPPTLGLRRRTLARLLAPDLEHHVAATGYLLTAFLIWAVLTALGAAGKDNPSTPARRLRRGRATRLARRPRARDSGRLLVPSAPLAPAAWRSE